MRKSLSKTTTRMLLDEISRMHGWALLSAVCAGFFIAVAAYEYENAVGDMQLIFGYVGLGAFAAVMALGFRLYMTRLLMPELERRAQELPPEAEPSGKDFSGQMKARQRLGKWGIVVLLLAIPAGILAQLYSAGLSENGGLTPLAWVVVALFAATGLWMVLRSAQCPSCSVLLQRRMSHETSCCPHCGAQLEPDRGEGTPSG